MNLNKPAHFNTHLNQESFECLAYNFFNQKGVPEIERVSGYTFQSDLLEGGSVNSSTHISRTRWLVTHWRSIAHTLSRRDDEGRKVVVLALGRAHSSKISLQAMTSLRYALNISAVLDDPLQ